MIQNFLIKNKVLLITLLVIIVFVPSLVYGVFKISSQQKRIGNLEETSSQMKISLEEKERAEQEEKNGIIEQQKQREADANEQERIENEMKIKEQEKQARLATCSKFQEVCRLKVRELDGIDADKSDGLTEIDGFSASGLKRAKNILDDNWKSSEYEHDYKIIKKMIESKEKKLSALLSGECKDYENRCE